MLQHANEVILTDDAAVYGFRTESTLSQEDSQTGNGLLDTSTWAQVQGEYFKLDARGSGAECIDCIGSFDNKKWSVDSYTGWATKKYTFENGFTATEVMLTQYEKAVRDYDNYLALYNESLAAAAAGESEHTMGRKRTFDEMFPRESYGSWVDTFLVDGLNGETAMVNRTFAMNMEKVELDYDYELHTDAYELLLSDEERIPEHAVLGRWQTDDWDCIDGTGFCRRRLAAREMLDVTDVAAEWRVKMNVSKIAATSSPLNGSDTNETDIVDVYANLTVSGPRREWHYSRQHLERALAKTRGDDTSAAELAASRAPSATDEYVFRLDPQ